LFLVWLVAMYWLAALGRGGEWPVRWRIAERIGSAARLGAAAFVALLALQLPDSFAAAANDFAGIPASRSRDLGALLRREHLLDATLIADPDVLLEPLPYYAPNPIFLLRERKFGSVARFTRHARVELSLGDMLADARTLRARTRRPVVILLHHGLDDSRPVTVSEGYLGIFSATPEQVRAFRSETRKLATLAPATSDEIYDVYLLPAGPAHGG
jgi:hypothetical protein